MSQAPKEEKGSMLVGIGMALGAGVGVAIGAGIGAATDNLAIGISIGVACGAGMGLAIATAFSAGKK